MHVKGRKQILIAILKLNFYTKDMMNQMETLFFYNLAETYINNIKLDSRYKMPLDELIIILKILINFKRINS